MHNNFRFEYLRVGKEIRTDRQIQIFTSQGHVVGHTEASFAEWLMGKLLPVDTKDREAAKLIESLDDAIADCKKHRRSIRDYEEGGQAWYEPTIPHKP